MSGQDVEIGGMPVDISQFDFSDTSSRVASVRIASIVLASLVVSVISLRLFARAKFVKQIFADDVLIVLAAILTLALAATSIAATTAGLGTHIWLLPPTTVLQSLKSCILYLIVCQVLYACAIALTKLAIISSYLRFIQDRTFRLVMYGTLFVTVGLWITGIFVPIFQCLPVTSTWSLAPGGTCINYVDYLYATSAINIFTDILLCTLPIPHLWRLHMPQKQRIILCVLFVGGAGACVANIVRVVYLHTLKVLDVPYQSVPTLNLSVLECSLGIICVSIPALRPMVVRIFPSGTRTAGTASSRTKPKTSQAIPLSTLSAYPKTCKSPSDHDSDTRSFQRLSSQEKAR